MGRKKQMIKSLKLMGYGVIETESEIVVLIKTRNNYGFQFRMSIESFIHENFVIETIVSEINKNIIETF